MRPNLQNQPALEKDVYKYEYTLNPAHFLKKKKTRTFRVLRHVGHSQSVRRLHVVTLLCEIPYGKVTNLNTETGRLSLMHPNFQNLPALEKNVYKHEYTRNPTRNPKP